METSNEKLSANLRKMYTTYKKSGSAPIILTPIQQMQQPIAQSRDVTAKPQVPLAQSWLPEDIRPRSSYNLPLEREIRTPVKLAHSVNNLYQLEDSGVVYEYEVEDAAGIPSLGFFKKPYTLPVNRHGRIGGSWRHIRQCTGQGGSNLLFVDGKIKDDDCQKYPPFGIVKSKNLVNHLGQRLIPKQKSTLYNEKARKGFQYWYKEPKANILEPPPLPTRTISGQQYKIQGK